VGRSHFGALTLLAPASVDMTAHAEAIETLAHQGLIALQRAASECALEQSEAQMRTAIDGMDDALHVVNEDLRLMLGNARFRNWLAAFGLDADFEGRELGRLFPFLPRKAFDEYRRYSSAASCS
jgi:hypothetical protein